MKLASFYTATETVINKKTAYGIGENIYKWCDRQGLSLQNIQTAQITQQQNTKQPNWKMGRRP